MNQLPSLEHFLGTEQVALNRTIVYTPNMSVCLSVPVFHQSLVKVCYSSRVRNAEGKQPWTSWSLARCSKQSRIGLATRAAALPPCTLSMEGNASQLPHESKATFRSSHRLKGLSNQICSEGSLKPHTRPTQTCRS